LLERSPYVCQDAHVPIFSSQVKASLGYGYVHSDRIADGLPLLDQAVEQPTMGRFYTVQICWVAEAYLLAGRRQEAQKLASRALSRARDKKERGHEAWVLRLLGEIAARADPPDVKVSEDYYRQALALAEELGMRPFIGHCHVGLGKLYGRNGDLRLAKKHLNNGVAAMREMEMGL
jgi:tetratricopeptide (TPR) repeat protein